MPIHCEIQGVKAVYNQGIWECDDEPTLELLAWATKDTLRPQDPEGEEGVRRVMRIFGGRITSITSSAEDDGVDEDDDQVIY